MYRLVETIQIKDSQFSNIQYHQLRFDNSQMHVYGVNLNIQLLPLLTSELVAWQNNTHVTEGLIKCRFEYDVEIHNISFELYSRKNIKSLKVVVCDTIDYTHKSTDRRQLQVLLQQANGCDEILICKNSMITDTSFTNVLFFDGQCWFTPATCLLKGTKRQALLDAGRIIEKSISINNFSKYQKVRLINAMIDFEDEVDIAIENIIF